MLNKMRDHLLDMLEWAMDVGVVDLEVVVEVKISK